MNATVLFCGPLDRQKNRLLIFLFACCGKTARTKEQIDEHPFANAMAEPPTPQRIEFAGACRFVR
jgi:hypothetical protein